MLYKQQKITNAPNFTFLRESITRDRVLKVEIKLYIISLPAWLHTSFDYIRFRLLMKFLVIYVLIAIILA